MKERGKKITCDRCGESIFLRELDFKEQETDGGYTRWKDYKYEDVPIGWTTQYFGKDLNDFCPTCTDIFVNLKKEFMAGPTLYKE